MDAPQNSGQNQNGQNNDKKTQLSWSQPSVKPSQNTGSPQRGEFSTKNSPTSGAVAPAYVSDKPVSASSSHGARNLTIAVVAIVVIGGIAWAISGHNKSSVATTASSASTTAQTTSSDTTAGTTAGMTVSASGETQQATFPSGSLVLPSPQSAGLEVAVSNITVQVPTWVVIYESYNGQPGNVLGAGLFTSDRTSGAVDLLRGTLPGQTYFAGEARDDGDHMFSMDNDPAVRDSSGNPIVLKFQTK